MTKMKTWWERRIRIVALGAIGFSLLGLEITAARAERSRTSECVQSCNLVYGVCESDCDREQDLCVARCGGGVDLKECRQSCKAMEKACHGSCGGLKGECKAACPRGKESPSEPQE